MRPAEYPYENLTPPERGSFVVGCFMAVFFAIKQATENLLAVTGFVSA
jgi:hypothetical protein